MGHRPNEEAPISRRRTTPLSLSFSIRLASKKKRNNCFAYSGRITMAIPKVANGRRRDYSRMTTQANSARLYFTLDHRIVSEIKQTVHKILDSS